MAKFWLAFSFVSFSSSFMLAQETAVSPSALAEYGFKSDSYLFTETGTVSELLEGPYNLQINDAATGGGAVTLVNGDNTFDGGISIFSGSLILPPLDAVYNKPSVIGRGNGAPIVLGPGTLRFTGESRLERDLLLASAGYLTSAADIPAAASVV